MDKPICLKWYTYISVHKKICPLVGNIIQQTFKEKFDNLQYWMNVKNARLGSYGAYTKSFDLTWFK